MSSETDLSVVDVNGARIAYVDAGHQEGETTLLLVHGFPLSHAMWRRQIDGLTDIRRVIAPDLRGYGDSTLGGWPSEEDASDASLDRYADDLAMLLDAAGAVEPVVFCGFSMGGYIAWSFWRRHRERVRAMVLADTRVVADNDTARATRYKMADHVAEWGAARVAELMRPNLFGPSAEQSVIDETVRVISATDPRAIAASQRTMAARPDSTALLAGVDAPTLVVVGADDAISPADEMRGVADAIPGAEFALIEGAGHMAPVEQPEAFNDALRGFLAGLD